MRFCVHVMDLGIFTFSVAVITANAMGVDIVKKVKVTLGKLPRFPDFTVIVSTSAGASRCFPGGPDDPADYDRNGTMPTPATSTTEVARRRLRAV